MIDLASTSLRRSARFSNKLGNKYGLFDILSLELIGTCEVDKNPHIFLTRANQNILEINGYFDETLNKYCLMVFEANQEQK